MFTDLDPLLHSQLRLSIMSVLIAERETDFNHIKEVTQASSGNISVQITKLEEAGYISVTKTFRNNYPHTIVSITEKGVDAFEKYVSDLNKYINPGK